MQSNVYKDKKFHNEKKEGIGAYSLAGIGIGGIIGAGFFLGSGLAINQAGPSVIAAFLLGGLIMSQVLGAMTSISINRPVRGSFRVYTEEFLGHYIGFTLGWVVYLSGILALSSEAVAAGVFLRYWFPNISVAVFAILILALVIGVNLLGTKNIGYIESGMSVIKIGILILFIIIGIQFFFSNGIISVPNPFSSMRSFFPNGISGFLQSMLIVIFTFSGVSAVAMATNEVRDPHRDIPKATVIMTIGLIALYCLSMAVIVSVVNWNSVSNTISPFVQSFKMMGINFMSAIMNAIILIAAVSVMTATYYAGTQMLVSLSEAKEAPALLRKANKKGIFRNAWLLVGISSLIVVGLSFVLGTKLFNYLISASSYFSFLNWTLNLLTYLVWLRHRKKEEKFNSPLILGRIGAYVSLVLIAGLFIISLRVTDFRMGFYAAAVMLAVISISYKFAVGKK